MKKIFFWIGGIALGLISTFVVLISLGVWNSNHIPYPCINYGGSRSALERGCYALAGTVITFPQHPDLPLTIVYENGFDTGPNWVGYTAKAPSKDKDAQFFAKIDPHNLISVPDSNLYFLPYIISDQSGAPVLKDYVYVGLFSLAASSKGPLIFQSSALLGSVPWGKAVFLPNNLFKNSDGSLSASFWTIGVGPSATSTFTVINNTLQRVK